MKNSKIEWTTHTFNPWWGCTAVSAGCANCYAETLSNRWKKAKWGRKGTRHIASEKQWDQLRIWDRDAAAAGKPARVFVSSMGDIFEGFDTFPKSQREAVTYARTRLFSAIESYPNLHFLLLTKRPQNISALVPERWYFSGFPQNVSIGCSVEDQATANTRIAYLMQIPCKIRFVSVEPMLGPVDITHAIGMSFPRGKTFTPAHEIAWVICGGESGPGARPMLPQWARWLRDSCARSGLRFFFKQWGEWMEQGDKLVKVGKAKAGRLLDGVEHNETPFT